MGAQLIAIAAEGSRRRIYLPATPEHEAAADVAIPADVPDTELPEAALGFRVQGYGMTHHADLFTPRQLTALTTFADLVLDARDRVRNDSRAAGLADGSPLESGGIGALAYADSLAVYLAFVVSRQTDYQSSLCLWAPDPKNEGVMHVFGRQTISMVWDFAEANALGASSGNWLFMLRGVTRTIAQFSPKVAGLAAQHEAGARPSIEHTVIATDPPYYDNVGYADLSDFFYVWLRRSLGSVMPSLLGTVLTPKADELVADPFRRGGKEEADKYFERGFVQVFERIRHDTPPGYPITVFYAFKQSETDDGGTASTGWEVLLQGMIRSGWEITATWPIRTERPGRMRDNASNALASSIVLACRPRPETAEATSRRGFLSVLAAELPTALRDLQQGSVAPVDLAQAAIGPGMAVFSRHSRVVEADGTDMAVRTALALINYALAEVLSQQEGDFDPDTRFCVAWFEQHGFEEGSSGMAETLSKAKNTSLAGLERGGVFRARAGKARLLSIEDLPESYDPARDERVSVWEVVLRLAKALTESGADEAARIMSAVVPRVDLDTAKELAYLLYSMCERKGWTQTALLFNGLGTSWNDLEVAARRGNRPAGAQGVLDYEDDES